jgi:type IV pilus assembly protein PilC
LYVSELREAGQGGIAKSAGTRGKAGGAGWRLKNLSMFARQLHVLVSSGTALTQALTAIERQTTDERWRDVVASLRKRVEEGTPLSLAMKSRPDCFDTVCRSLVAAGETSGMMTAMLERLANLTRKQLSMRQAVIGALVYPLLLIALGGCVLLVMLMFVLPRFTVLFEQLDNPLPPTTQMLMWMSHRLWEFWWAIPIVLVGGFFAGRAWVRSASGRNTLHTMILKAPKAGQLVQSVCSAKLARMLGTLLESRVPLMEALQLTRESFANLYYSRLVTAAENAVTAGEPISSVLSHSHLIAPCVQEAIRNGEQSGQLGQPLLHMADFLDEENDLVIKTLTRVVEPAILIVLGGIVGFIAMSMFLPLFDLVSAAQGGH